MASLQGISETGLEKGRHRRDAEETISGREKVMEMTHSLWSKTRITGKQQEPGLGHTKGDFGQQ